MSESPLELAAVGELVLRPVLGRDRPFLLSLYASTRAEELKATGWPEGRCRAFLASQFHAQQRHYAQAPRSQHRIVERHGEPVGQLRWQWMRDELRVVDIALVPQWRGRGLGTRLMLALKEAALRRELPVTLHVDVGNPAQALYRRLGFEVTGSAGIYLRMVASPCNTQDQ
jgi:ribosomal protein S18 acetylase RimI-like enzyme